MLHFLRSLKIIVELKTLGHSRLSLRFLLQALLLLIERDHLVEIGDLRQIHAVTPKAWV